MKDTSLAEYVELLERAIQQANDAIVITTAELDLPGPRIVYVNPAFTTLTGYTAEELLGQTPRLLQGPRTERATLDRARQALQTGQPFVGEITNYRKEGTAYCVEWRMSPLRGRAGTITHWVAIQRDITAQKRTEAAVSALTTAVHQSHADLQQLVMMFSHDLREPLRMVRSYVQLLAQRYRGQLDATAAEFIAYAVEGVQRMEQLLHALLTYCQLGLQQPATMDVACETLWEQTLAALGAEIAESGAVITHDPLPIVKADPGQLRQVLHHLVRNALKFCGPHSPWVHGTAWREGPHWVFAVQDKGIGLDTGQAGRLFALGQRLHVRTHYPGLGVGLAVCKKIIERL